MPTPNALPDALVRRFADNVERLTGNNAADRIGIAVSGGPDSLALLLLANAAFQGRIEAATVDHRLRPASTNEAQFVADICAARNIPHAILTLDALPGGNVSAKARVARYAALGTWAEAKGINWLMTAHHADDQRETVIMRLNRGAGVGGLSGIRAQQGRLVRPLLHWRHDELATLVADAGIIAIDDPTNHDDAYDRARLRKSLRDADWIDAQAVAISADALADAEAAIEWTVDHYEASHITQDSAGVSFERHSVEFPVEILRRLTLRCLRRVDPNNEPRGVSLSRFIATLESGGSATLGNVMGRGAHPWRFSPAPPRRPIAQQ